MSIFKSTKQTELCPQCQSPLQIKNGKKGLFLGCSAYPACDYIKPLHQTNRVLKELDALCPECGHNLQLKQGNFGIFIGCSHYPECHFVVHEEAEQEEQFECPECKRHHLIARKGRSGKTFYGCAGFPECKFTLAGKPVQHICPECQCTLTVEKKQRGKTVYQCANKACQHISEENE